MSTQTSFNPREVGACFIDVNSAARNTASSISSVAPLSVGATTFVASSCIAAGVVGVPLGCAITRDGCKGIKTAIQTNDPEGLALSGAWTTVGATYAGLSGVLGAAGAYSLLDWAAPALHIAAPAAPAVLTPVFGYGGLALYGALLGYGGYGLAISSNFSSKLNELGDSQALEWLHGQVSLTPEEGAACKTNEAKEKLLQKKCNAFKRRAGADGLAAVQEKLSAPQSPLGATQAKELIQEVQKSCFKQKMTYTFLVVLGLLGIAASVFVIHTWSFSSPLLFVIGAVGWLGVDNSKLHKYLGEKFWQWLGKEPPAKGEQQPLLTN